jgi:hypothetical protein
MTVGALKMPSWVSIPDGPTHRLKNINGNNVLQGRKSGSSFPINLLGGGSWQWPEALQLDRATREKICRAEISELSEWPPDDEGPMRMERD